MPTSFWIKRYFTVFFWSLAIISIVQFLKGKTLQYSLTHGTIWAVISTGIFVATRYTMARRNIPCALCKDTPEFNDAKSDAKT